jgi:hypothetical protein
MTYSYREEPVGTIKVEVDKRDGMVTAVFIGKEEVSCGDWWRTLLYRQGIYAIAVSSQRDGIPRLVLGWEVGR